MLSEKIINTEKIQVEVDPEVKSGGRPWRGMVLASLPRNQKMFWLSVLGFSSITYMVVALSKFRPAVVPIFPPPELEETSVCSTSTTAPSSSLPTIYFITPTYPRREQVAELTRLGQTLLLAANIHWVIAEDSASCSPLVAALLSRLGLPYTHLTSPQPAIYKSAKLKFNPRGVSSRRAGLAWVMKHIQGEGVVYFGDDDNTYDIRLFAQIAGTKKVSMFPVGFIGGQGVSSPVVVGGKVVGFSDDWFAQRQFPVDMAGFAVGLKFLRDSHPRADRAMPYKAGYEEDMFLQNLKLELGDIEPLASDCTEVLVWHTKTVKEKKASLKLPEEERGDGASNLATLLDHVSFSGMVDISKGGKKVKTCYDMKKCKTNG